MKPPVVAQKQLPDAQSYLIDLLFLFGRCKNDWDRYADAVSEAYAWAWTHQSAVLKGVKEGIEIRRKAEEADALFALNMLTCGVGGGLAAFAAKKVLSTAGEELSEKFVEKMVDMAKEKAQEPGKKASEWLYKHLGNPEVGEAFSPVGVSPAEFGAHIKEGIEYRMGTLWDLGEMLRQEAHNGITTEGARKVYETIANMPFIINRPKRQVSTGNLKVSALLALWLAWGWARDSKYWKIHSHLPTNGGENVDFEPVRASLVSCGVPEALISQQFMGWMAYKDVEKLRKSQKEVDMVTDLKVIDMDAFINWANSDAVVEVLFKGLPRNLEWFNEIPIQLKIRRALPPFARGGGGGE